MTIREQAARASPLELNPAAAGKPRFARPFIVDGVCGQSEPALRSRFFCGQTAGVSLLASESLRERAPLLPAPSHSLLTVHQEPGQLMGPRRSFQTSTAFRSPAGYDIHLIILSGASGSMETRFQRPAPPPALSRAVPRRGHPFPAGHGLCAKRIYGVAVTG